LVYLSLNWPFPWRFVAFHGMAVAVLPSWVMGRNSHVVPLILVISAFKFTTELIHMGWGNQNITCLNGQLHLPMGLFYWEQLELVYILFLFNESMALGLIGSYHNCFKFIWVTFFE
jgi:hypothetical protein